MYENMIEELRYYENSGLGCISPYEAGEIADILEYLNENQIKGYCITCARSSTIRNDNTTRCPLEEHYALPDDGFCHLYESVKSNR